MFSRFKKINNFFNIAEVTSNGKTDISTNGLNADPDEDGDPSNNEEPTQIQFKIDIAPDRPAIGIALSISDSSKIDSKRHFKREIMDLISYI